MRRYADNSVNYRATCSRNANAERNTHVCRESGLEQGRLLGHALPVLLTLSPGYLQAESVLKTVNLI